VVDSTKLLKNYPELKDSAEVNLSIAVVSNAKTEISVLFDNASEDDDAKLKVGRFFLHYQKILYGF